MAKKVGGSTSQVRINDVDINFDRNVAIGPGGELRIEPKLARLLNFLIEEMNSVVSRQRLIDHVWDGAHGADQSLSNAISQLRKILNERETGDVIETVPKRGYRFVAHVSWAQGAGLSSEDKETIDANYENGPIASPLSRIESFTTWNRNKLLAAIFSGAIVVFLAIVLFDGGQNNVGESSAEKELDAFASIDPASIAVLPFINISSDVEQGYFSDGISEEILNVLVDVDGLKVASRTSSFSFKNNEAALIPEIAIALNVRHILEGSVRKSGDSIRITAQLIDAKTDQHLFSETYERTLTAKNMFSIQDEIAKSVLAALGDEMLDQSRKVEVREDTLSFHSYEAYLKARELFLVRNTENLPRAISMFEKAVSKDPEFARAWAGLAAAYQIAPTWVLLDRDYASLANNAAEKAISLDPELALPHAVLALGHTDNNPANYSNAFRHFDDALKIDPDDTTVLLWRGINHVATGFFDKANSDFLHCLKLDSTYEICRRWLALSKLFSGDTAEALELFEKGASQGERAHIGIFAKAYAAENNRRAAFLTWAWDSRDLNLDRERYFRAYTDPSFEFDTETLEFEAEYETETGRQPNWGEIGGIDYAHTFKRYADLQAYRFYPVWWLRMHEDFLISPHRKRLIREHGVLAYWKEHGFPPQCRPVGEDDFNCD